MVIGSQTPRISSVPKHATSVGDAAVAWSLEHKIQLDPWQQLVLRGGLGKRADGKFSTFEVAMCVARQNGKGEILLARELYGACEMGEKLIIHSAHEFATSSEHFRRMEDKLEEAGLEGQLKAKGGIKRSHGEEGFEFRNGARIRFRTRTKGGGRGFTGDLVVLDEAMVLDEFFHGTLLPIVSARSIHGNPQVWYAGSAVDQLIHDNGVVFARMRKRGLNREPDIAYFEWSMKADNPDDITEETLASLDAQALANPGMGIRIAPGHIAKELRSMDKRTFAVERGCVGDWPSTDGLSSVIDLELWERLADTKSVPITPAVYAFDVRPNRSRGVIAAVGRRVDGQVHIEIGEQQEGVGWIVPRLEALSRKNPIGIVCDGVGPASSLVPGLVQRNVQVHALSTSEVGEACGMFYDAVLEERLRHLSQPELLHAIKGAAQRTLGDRWAWSRRNSISDISPLVACTLGVWGLETLQGAAGVLVAA